MSESSVRKKSGHPDALNYTDDQLHLQELEPLARQLEKDLPDEKLDAKGIAQFQVGLLHFMEDTLGARALRPKAFPKLPMHLIDDIRPSGALYEIIMKTFQMKEAKDIKKLEWRSPQLRIQIQGILEAVRNMLIKNGHPVSPVVHLHESLSPDDVAQLSEMVRTLKGRIAPVPDDPEITHIVFPFGVDGDPDDGNEYMRTQRLRGQKALVHHWYLPDSYNDWLDPSVAPETIDADAEHVLKGPAKVYLRWVKDSIHYNEWMNAIDYETDEGAEDHERFRQQLERDGLSPAAFLAKRKAARQGGSAHKVFVAEGPQQEVDPDFAEPAGEGVVRRRVVQPHKKVLEGSTLSENLSLGQLPKLYEPSSAAAAMAAARVAAPTVTLSAASTPAAFTIPAFAHWFRFGSVHDIERHGNVEFFNNASPGKTEALYVQYRDFMVREYRRDPRRKLTFLNCRRCLVGDVNAIHRVWAFLDSWGIINYEALPPRHPDEPVDVIKVDACNAPLGRAVRVLRPPPKALAAPSTHSLAALPVVTPTEGVQAALAPLGRHNVTVAAKKDAAGRALLQGPGGPLEFFCNAMPWVNCTNARYHCTRFPDIDICPQAFAEGRFPPGTCAKDFIYIDRSSATPDKSGWSDQETLLLLEALELYGERWAEVAEHVGTKSQVDCVLHFLQLPIEEEFVADLEAAPAVELGVQRDVGVVPEPGYAQPAAPNIPFADTANPVTAQLAFLGEVVGPKVAAAAAAAALQELFEAGSVVPDPLLRAAVQQVNRGNAALRAAAEPKNGRAEAVAARHNKEGVAGGATGDGPPEPDGNITGEAATAMQVDGEEAQERAVADDAAVGAASGKSADGQETEVRLSDPVDTARMRAAAAASLAGAAVKAKLLAEAERQRMEQLMMSAIEALAEKLQHKIRYLKDLETEMQKAHAGLVDARHKALQEREQLAQQRMQLSQQQQLLSQLTHLQRVQRQQLQTAPAAVADGAATTGSTLHMTTSVQPTPPGAQPVTAAHPGLQPAAVPEKGDPAMQETTSAPGPVGKPPTIVASAGTPSPASPAPAPLAAAPVPAAPTNAPAVALGSTSAALAPVSAYAVPATTAFAPVQFDPTAPAAAPAVASQPVLTSAEPRAAAVQPATSFSRQAVQIASTQQPAS